MQRTRGVSLAKGPIAVIGLLGIIYGLSALIVRAHGFALHFPSGQVHGEFWLRLEVNGWTALLFIAAGLALVFSAAAHITAKTMAMLVGLVMIALAIIGVIQGHGTLGIFASNHWTELVWAAGGVVLVLLALMPRVGGRTTGTAPATTTAGDSTTGERPVATRRVPADSSERPTAADTYERPGETDAPERPVETDAQERPAGTGARAVDTQEHPLGAGDHVDTTEPQPAAATEEPQSTAAEEPQPATTTERHPIGGGETQPAADEDEPLIQRVQPVPDRGQQRL